MVMDMQASQESLELNGQKTIIKQEVLDFIT